MDGDSYLYRRAEAELKMAQRAADPTAARAHYTLAGHYLDRFYRPGAQRRTAAAPQATSATAAR